MYYRYVRSFVTKNSWVYPVLSQVLLMIPRATYPFPPENASAFNTLDHYLQLTFLKTVLLVIFLNSSFHHHQSWLMVGKILG